ncbi:MAG: uracil-DNA glycosylase [Deltaproteobacteria bacterium]|nr:uracil-DNA glycosylase [Deltaproteobacteria bacterium]
MVDGHTGLGDILSEVRAQLWSMRELGLDRLALKVPAPPKQAQHSPFNGPRDRHAPIKDELQPVIKPAKPVVAVTPAAGFHLPEVGNASLEDIRQELRDCKRCRLCQDRTNIVFGEGYDRARLVFVGEWPAQDEDMSGRPLAGTTPGSAGEMFTNILKAINISRREVYLTSVVKCRPPANRKPDKEEIDTCRIFLEKQLAVIKPQLVCALGQLATQVLLNSSGRLTQLRGKFYQVGPFQVLPTYYPAYLLTNPKMKRPVWEDVQLLAGVYNPKS